MTEREVWVVEFEGAPALVRGNVVARQTEKEALVACKYGPDRAVRYIPAESAPAPTANHGRERNRLLLLASELVSSFKEYDPDMVWVSDLTKVADALAAAEARGAASAIAQRGAAVCAASCWPVRPVVRWFAEQMEAALQLNDHKGGWHEDDPLDLANRVADEQDELACALQVEDEYEASVPPDPSRVISEAADVANMAMMVADHFREGGPSRDQGREGQAGPAVRVHHRELAAMLTQAERDGFAAGAASAIGRAGESEQRGPDRLWEARQLLHRMVKRVRGVDLLAERNADLAKLVDQVGDYLQRTHDPRSILRAETAPPNPPPADPPQPEES